MSSTIHPSVHDTHKHTGKRQGGKRYAHNREARLPRPRKRPLIDPETAKMEQQARRSERTRALCVFEEFEYNGVDERLRRRRDVYLKRWGLVALSERFSIGKLDGRATLILTIVTEEAQPAETTPAEHQGTAQQEAAS